MSGKIDLVSLQVPKCIAKTTLGSESCKYTPERIYPYYAQRFYGILCVSMAKGSELTLRVAKIPEKSISHKLLFFTNLGVLQTFLTNQTAANKQGIHGLLQSGFPCTLNMVLHVKTMCGFGMERKYPN